MLNSLSTLLKQAQTMDGHLTAIPACGVQTSGQKACMVLCTT